MRQNLTRAIGQQNFGDAASYIVRIVAFELRLELLRSVRRKHHGA